MKKNLPGQGPMGAPIVAATHRRANIVNRHPDLSANENDTLHIIWTRRRWKADQPLPIDS